MQSSPNCPRCNQPLTYVYQYQQWYCPAEGVYPWAGAPSQSSATPAQAQTAAQPAAQVAAPVQAAPASQPAAQTHACPRCGKPLQYVPQYQQWYCPAEGVYPWAMGPQSAAPQQHAQPQEAQPSQSAPATQPAESAQPVQAAAQAQSAAQTQACPRCGRPLQYVYQYQRWYCPSEGVYPWG